MTTKPIKQICPECVGKGKRPGTRVYDYVRGDRTEWCIRCDGHGEIVIGYEDAS